VRNVWLTSRAARGRGTIPSCEPSPASGWTDWLGFAHLVIAVAFWGPIKDPVRNVWVVQFGMIACLAVIPFALIAGPIRGIPWWWQLIDMSFGIVGIVPLLAAYAQIRRLAAQRT
jgi:hypothetical protein